MGIDIYLNGYDSYKERTKDEETAFDNAVKLRDSQPRESVEANAAQELVDAAYDAMHSGSKGYIRSSYNSSGLFPVLQEIFGFDVGAWLFPGNWRKGVPINGAEFVVKVENLEQAAMLALKNGHRELPWICEFSEATGQPAPDPINDEHIAGEQFGLKVLAMFGEMAPGEVLTVEPAPREQSPQFNQAHVWYVTEGLKDLRQFGELAKESGEGAFAYISY